MPHELGPVDGECLVEHFQANVTGDVRRHPRHEERADEQKGMLEKRAGDDERHHPQHRRERVGGEEAVEPGVELFGGIEERLIGPLAQNHGVEGCPRLRGLFRGEPIGGELLADHLLLRVVDLDSLPGIFDPPPIPRLKGVTVEGDFDDREEGGDVRPPQAGDAGRAEERRQQERPTLGGVPKSTEEIVHGRFVS